MTTTTTTKVPCKAQRRASNHSCDRLAGPVACSILSSHPFQAHLSERATSTTFGPPPRSPRPNIRSNPSKCIFSLKMGVSAQGPRRTIHRTSKGSHCSTAGIRRCRTPRAFSFLRPGLRVALFDTNATRKPQRDCPTETRSRPPPQRASSPRTGRR